MDREQLEPILTTAIKAAKAGGKAALARRDTPGYMRWKGPREIQFGAVLEIQKEIVDTILADYPDARFLVEESDEPQDEQADPLWVIDPIDGSLNFNQGIPLYAVCIAYRVAGRYEIGVVYDPCTDELFHAMFMQGAYLNGQPITVTKVSEGEDAFSRALVATDLPGGIDDRKAALYVNRSMGSDIIQLWSMGSPALAICYLAAGRLHAYFALRLKIWDVAAAYVILKEAGGTFTDITGGPWTYSDGGYVATNGVIHGGVLRAIKPALDIYRLQQSKLGALA
jgi:myo-inositol-1(or 4)-monophosphatase